MFAIAVTAGKSIAAGERAAVLSGGFDLLLGLAAALVFALASGGLPRLWRVLATALFVVLETSLLVVVLLLGLVLLNR